MNSFTFVLVLVVVIFGFIYLMARSGVRRTDQRYNPEDTELIQELNRGMERMEKRVEALETLLLDRSDRTERSERIGR